MGPSLGAPGFSSPSPHAPPVSAGRLRTNMQGPVYSCT
ncbi:hypothetical protein KR76_00093 [Pimelobacter simplex]|uniref:Uncharacterized protein n=1 Tax=Nocardioides simplex TaxID=2045 RepID=A0A0C5XGX7_NOCSI|nr:hypothetical protein KR76_00093 [Pimelobacter simplex]